MHIRAARGRTTGPGRRRPEFLSRRAMGAVALAVALLAAVLPG
ncbi:MAG: hypothetical protein JWR24_2670, partial [Actinoallomurus sp.]|nr:hypothetical protein [Actinoallomurus sp.]